jgi:hypothetical protein
MNPGELSLRDPYAQAWINLPPNIETVRQLIDSGYAAAKGFLPVELKLSPHNFKHETVLDFGCGLGRNATLFSAASSIIGYDNAVMLNNMDAGLKEFRYNSLYPFEEWQTLKEIYFSNTIFASLVFQHMSERVLRAYLEDMTTMCHKLHIVSRWYTDEGNKLIWPILKDYFNCLELYVHPDENILYAKPAPENQLHFEAVLTPK